VVDMARILASTGGLVGGIRPGLVVA
jgi:hypothetical protein